MNFALAGYSAFALKEVADPEFRPVKRQIFRRFTGLTAHYTMCRIDAVSVFPRPLSPLCAETAQEFFEFKGHAGKLLYRGGGV